MVKKYIREASSDEFMAFFDQFEVISTSALTQVEMAAAMANAVRLGWVDENAIHIAWKDFLSHWPAYTRLPASPGILEHAALLAWKHGLSAYDSLHLASALTWQEAAGDVTTFACFDRHLQQAARLERLEVWPGNTEKS